MSYDKSNFITCTNVDSLGGCRYLLKTAKLHVAPISVV